MYASHGCWQEGAVDFPSAVVTGLYAGAALVSCDVCCKGLGGVVEAPVEESSAGLRAT